MRSELVFALKLAIYMGVPVIVTLLALWGFVALGAPVNGAGPLMFLVLVLLEMGSAAVAMWRET